MAAAIPAAIGVGSSLVGGIQGKGAAKKQQKLAEQQLKQIQPLIDAKIRGTNFALDQAKPLYGLSQQQIMGAETGIRDLQRFWQPLLRGNRNAFDMFLAPERRAINQGFLSADAALAKYAPRGGNSTSQRYRANIERQGKLSDLMFGARREAAGQQANLAQMLSQLGLGTGGLATSTLGAGLSGGQDVLSSYNQQANRAYGQLPKSGGSAKGLGGFLVDLFSNPSVQKGIGGIFGGGGGRDPDTGE